MSIQLPPPPGPGPAWTRSLADPPRAGVVAKALSLAVFAGLIAGALGTFVLVILWGALFVGERLGWVEGTTMSMILVNGRSVAAWLTVVLTVWAGGYGTTVRGSGPRIVAGLTIGVPIGFGVMALGSPAWTVAAVGIGWAVAIPASSIRTTAIRAAPALLLGLASIPLEVVGPAAELGAGLGGVLAAGATILVMVGVVEPALRRRAAVPQRKAVEADGPPEDQVAKVQEDDLVDQGSTEED